MADELITLLGGRIIGQVRKGGQGRLTFNYDADWREADEAYPLSLAMPVDAAIDTYL
jgi:serine/threonine-protein kinase HipA